MTATSIAWGKKVSATFLDRVKWIVEDLDIGYGVVDGTSKLMACMAWESNETFSPRVRNMAGSGATGLIQFMPSTARTLGTTVEALAAMSAEDQLNYVWKYFAPYKGRLKTLGDLYMAILWPLGVGKSETYVLWDRNTRPTTYRQNSGLDLDKDGTITKAEATSKVAEKLSIGMGAQYALTVMTGVVDVGTDVQEDSNVSTVVLEPVIERPKTKLDRVADSILNGVTGTAVIAGSLLLNPDFATKLGQFTVALARGEASWGALFGVIGLALVVAGQVRKPNPPKTSI